MIGYAGPGTNDLPRARSFYDTLLAEMAVTRQTEFGIAVPGGPRPLTSRCCASRSLTTAGRPRWAMA